MRERESERERVHESGTILRRRPKCLYSPVTFFFLSLSPFSFFLSFCVSLFLSFFFLVLSLSPSPSLRRVPKITASSVEVGGKGHYTCVHKLCSACVAVLTCILFF